MQSSEDTFQGDAGLELYYKSWHPADQPKAVIVILHGVAEHSDRYLNVVDNLVPLGYAIYAYDQRGHGKSPGQRGYLESWDEYRSDLKHFLDLVHQQEPGLPVFMYGHSQGALIALDFLINESNNLSGALVSASPLASDDAASPMLVTAAKILSRVWPTFSLDSPINPSQLSCDARVVQKYQDDPAVFKILTARWGTEYLKTQDEVREQAYKIDVPILIMHGGEDSLCDPEGSQYLYEQVSSADKTLKIYPSYFHEIHNEPGHITVIQDMNEWMSARLPGDETGKS
ncbi:MAG: lysophospholipase [Anaerolineales bacterium]|nr:lysophospholipase [Anaerolineales bacterium]